MPHVEYKGRKLYYEIHDESDGSSAKQPLVLIQGMGGTCRGWVPLQVPDFARDRQVLIYDHRGVGDSEAAPGAFTTADLADDLVGLLDALSIARVDALGVFMGGMVAQELALQHPARLRKLVLTGTYARPDAKRRMLLEDWIGLTEAGISYEAMLRKRIVWSLQDETLEQTDLIEAMVSFASKEPPFSPEVFVSQCRACLEHDTYDRLRGIEQETLLICGRHDQLTPPKFHRELADEIPNARLITTHYGGHLVMVEAAERFNHSVRQFLDDET